MRIAFLLPCISFEGGVRVVATYVRALADRGHEVHAYSLGRTVLPPPRRRLRILASSVLRGNKQVAKMMLRRRVWNQPSHFDALPDLHTRLPHGPPITAADVPPGDAVVATWWESVAWMKRLPADRGKRFHLIQHDERAMCKDAAEAGRCGELTWRTPGVIRVAVSEWVRQAGLRDFGVDSHVVENATDHEIFHPAGTRTRNKRFTVGLMASPATLKATPVAAEAVRRARAAGLDVRVRAFGLRDREHAVNVLGLPADTDYFAQPPQRKIADIYRSCDLWLVPSRLEGYGLPVLEALACGTPTVATPAGAAPQLIGQGGGHLVPVDDPRAMCRAIRATAALSPPQWKLLSDAALSTARRRTWPKSVDAFEALLRGEPADHPARRPARDLAPAV